jgi:hypothetical protein
MTETERLVSETIRSRREDRLAAHRQGVDADRPDVTGLRPDAEKIKRSHPRVPFRDRMLTQLASDPGRTYGKHRRSLLST